MPKDLMVRTYLTVTSAVVLIIGLLFLIVPSQTADFFTGTEPGKAKVFIMFLGTSLIGYSMLNHLASKVNYLGNLRPFFWGNMSALGLAIPLSIYGLANGWLNDYGYLILGVHVLFFSGFYYCLKLISVSED